MALLWLTVLQCFCALTTTGYASDIHDSDKNNDPVFELLEMHVRSEVGLRYSRTSVTLLIMNPVNISQEATIKIPVPRKAFITGFSANIEGKQYNSHVREKKIFTEEEKSDEHLLYAALLRRAQVFTAILNMTAKSTAFLNLTYEDFLIRRNGVYKHAVELNLQNIPRNLTVAVHILEDQKIVNFRIPKICWNREGTFVTTEEEATYPKAEITKSADAREVTVVIKPKIETDSVVQLMVVPLCTHNNLEQPKSDDYLAVYIRPLIMQYDVDRSVNNELMTNDGYFAHFGAPTKLPLLHKYVIFVLDLSTGMVYENPRLLDAVKIALGELRSGDFFSFMSFGSSVQIHDINEKQTESLPFEESDMLPKLEQPFSATPENINQAKAFLTNLYEEPDYISPDERGNVFAALDVAVELAQKGVGWNYTEDSSEDKLMKSETESNDGDNLVSMILSFAYGDSVETEESEESIIERLSQTNYGQRKASINALIFGESEDVTVLTKVSSQNGGLVRYVADDSDLVVNMRDFYEEICSLLPTYVKFNYPAAQVKEGSVTKIKFNPVDDGPEIVVAGQLEISQQMNNNSRFEVAFNKTRDKIPSKVIQLQKKNVEFSLEQLWAYLTTQQLLEDIAAAKYHSKLADNFTEIQKQALELALKYSFLTKMTSLEVVTPDGRAFSYGIEENLANLGRELTSIVNIFGRAFPIDISLYSWAPRNVFAKSAKPSGLSEFEPSKVNTSITSNFTPTLAAHSGPDNTLPEDTVTEHTTESEGSLQQYHLEQYPWTEPLLDFSTDQMVIKTVGGNGTEKIYLKLAKDKDVHDLLCNFQCWDNKCCEYLPCCESARNISVDVYLSKYCLIRNFAGVYCS